MTETKADYEVFVEEEQAALDAQKEVLAGLVVSLANAQARQAQAAGMVARAEIRVAATSAAELLADAKEIVGRMEENLMRTEEARELAEAKAVLALDEQMVVKLTQSVKAKAIEIFTDSGDQETKPHPAVSVGNRPGVTILDQENLILALVKGNLVHLLTIKKADFNKYYKAASGKLPKVEGIDTEALVEFTRNVVPALSKDLSEYVSAPPVEDGADSATAHVLLAAADKLMVAGYEDDGLDF